MDETAQLAAEREALLDMFEHPGWAALTRQTKQRVELFREGMPFNIQNEHQLYFARGMMATLNELLHLPDSLAVPVEEEEEFSDTPDEGYVGPF